MYKIRILLRSNLNMLREYHRLIILLLPLLFLVSSILYLLFLPVVSKQCSGCLKVKIPFVV